MARTVTGVRDDSCGHCLLYGTHAQGTIIFEEYPCHICECLDAHADRASRLWHLP